MSRKSVILTMIMAMTFFMTACSTANTNMVSDQNSNVNTSNPAEQENDTSMETPISTEASGIEVTKIKSIDELNEIVLEDLENSVATLNDQYEELKTQIDTYEKFSADTQKIESFYSDTYKITKEMCIKMREYSLAYARFILDSDSDKSDKYDDFEEVYDTIYDDGGELIYDEIYDGILDEIYDVFYDGILDEAYDTVGYEEWSDACSDEYERWSDTRSDVYEEWSDMRSEVYEFYSDVRSEVWDADFQKAEEIILEFREDTADIKEQ